MTKRAIRLPVNCARAWLTLCYGHRGFRRVDKYVSLIAILIVAVAFSVGITVAQPAAQPSNVPAQSATGDPFLLNLPTEDGPVVVRASFEVHDINAINDEKETFEFTGVLTLKWHDKRQAFDPVTAGVSEKVYQGDYQFNEISPGWFPQVVLVNSAGSYESQGVVLRVQPDGSQTFIQKINAAAKTEFNLRRFPFDGQSLQAIFGVLGFDDTEVVLKVDSDSHSSTVSQIWIPEWTVTGISMSVQAAPYAGQRTASAFVTSIGVQRESFYVSRLVTLPLIVIVLLSFSVFWMDRSSLGDRINVSFIGILTAVAYQVVMSELLPRIAYVTWMNAFLNFSFLMMVGTVVVNLIVGALDQRGMSEVGDRIDRRCRWIFPLIYFGLILFAFGVAFLVF